MKNLFVLALVLLLSMFTFGLRAQEEGAKKENEVRLKVVKETDEGRTVIDTVLNIGELIDDEEIVEIEALLNEYGLGDIDLEISKMDELLEDIDIEIEEITGERKGETEMIIVTKGGEGSEGKRKKVMVTVTSDDSINLEKTVKVSVDDDSYKYVIVDSGDGDTGEDEEVFIFTDEDGKKTRVMVGGEQMEWIDAEGAVQMTVEVDDEGEVYVIKSGDETIELKDVSSDHLMILKSDGSEEGEKEVFVEVFETKEGDRSVRIRSTIVVSSLNEKDRKMLEKAGVDIGSEKDETLHLERLGFHPNPTDGKFKVTFEAEAGAAVTVQVFDMNGNEVLSRELKNQDGRYEQEIDLSAEKSGIYFLRISQGKKAVSKKIIVE